MKPLQHYLNEFLKRHFIYFAAEVPGESESDDIKGPQEKIRVEIGEPVIPPQIELEIGDIIIGTQEEGDEAIRNAADQEKWKLVIGDITMEDENATLTDVKEPAVLETIASPVGEVDVEKGGQLRLVIGKIEIVNEPLLVEGITITIPKKETVAMAKKRAVVHPDQLAMTFKR